MLPRPSELLLSGLEERPGVSDPRLMFVLFCYVLFLIVQGLVPYKVRTFSLATDEHKRPQFDDSPKPCLALEVCQ